MIRAPGALAFACALAACGVLGPPQADLERAVRAYYAGGQTNPAVPDLSDATIADFEGCRPLRGFYQCPVIFQTPDGRVPTLIWLERDSGGWRVQNIALNVPRR